MTTAKSKICNFNCSCIREDCSYDHYIKDLEDRKDFKDLFDATIDKRTYNETDPDGVRKKICAFGILCNNEDCGYKHYCSPDGRMLMRREWFKIFNKQKNSSFLEELNEKYNFSTEDYERLAKIIDRK